MDKSIEKLICKLPFYDRYISDESVTEIKIRAFKNIILNNSGGYVTLDNTAVSLNEIKKLFLVLCEYTVPAYEHQIAKGFITTEGGHRIGIGGKFRVHDGKLILIEVTSLNIRLNRFIHFEYPDNLMCFSKGLLIIGRPHSGKTSLLRSLCRNSNEQITVCDERNELYYEQPDCDFICGIPKYIAVEQATRSMNPDIIVCDEIGNAKEAERILSYVNTGVKFICTAHCNDIPEIYKKPNLKLLVSAGVFDKIAVLSESEFKIKDIVCLE